MNEQLIGLGVRLTEILAKNTVSAVTGKISAVKAENDDKKTISAMQEIINDLTTDKQELINIARAFEEEIEQRKISKEDIKYISQSFIPVIEELSKSVSDSEESENLSSIISTLEPILSIETFTILQLIGFNFKKGLGEPLTDLLSSFIKSQQPSKSENKSELQYITKEHELEIAKMINDEEAYERYKEIMNQN